MGPGLASLYIAYPTLSCTARTVFSQGPLGKGVRTILEMVVHTRLDCTLGSAGLMRQAVRNTIWYAAHRSAFGTVLAGAPAMQSLLADLAVESEAAVWTAMKLAALFQQCVEQPGDARLQAFRRLATAVAKFYVCKRCPNVVYEALEGIGGNGYVEEWQYPRWYRQAPLNSVWEGSGNVMTLDILRTCQAEPAALAALIEYASTATAAVKSEVPGLAAAVKGALASMQPLLSGGTVNAFYARHIAQSLAIILQAGVLAEALVLAPRVASAVTSSGGTRAVSDGRGPAASDGAAGVAAVAEWWVRAHAQAGGGTPAGAFVAGTLAPALSGGGGHSNPTLATAIIEREVEALWEGAAPAQTSAPASSDGTWAAWRERFAHHNNVEAALY